MIRNQIVRLFVAVLFVVGKASCQLDHYFNLAPKPVSNKDYLGSPASKAYFFPWMVSIHREYAEGSELFGSGSILTPVWVLVSMDSFVRKSRVGIATPFFQDIKNLTVYSSGIWGTPYLKDNRQQLDWLEKRKVLVVYMWSDPDTSTARTEQFYANNQPYSLNDFKRSPFGFSMSIALVKIKEDAVQYPKIAGLNRWIWRRITLPIPLFANQAQQLRVRLESEIERFEKAPYSTQCYLGGWRLQDYRLVQHKVIYVPFKRCQAMYCAFDPRACYKWPVKGVHVCFKSLSFTNPCWTDQGSALYCTHISESVIAILTSAPTCGFYGLPGVYTLIHHGMELLEHVFGPNEGYTPILMDETNKYTPPPQKSLFPVYR